jgi:hypothetical protein
MLIILSERKRDIPEKEPEEVEREKERRVDVIEDVKYLFIYLFYLKSNNK